MALNYLSLFFFCGEVASNTHFWGLFHHCYLSFFVCHLLPPSSSLLIFFCVLFFSFYYTYFHFLLRLLCFERARSFKLFSLFLKCNENPLKRDKEKNEKEPSVSDDLFFFFFYIGSLLLLFTCLLLLLKRQYKRFLRRLWMKRIVSLLAVSGTMDDEFQGAILHVSIS